MYPRFLDRLIFISLLLPIPLFLLLQSSCQNHETTQTELTFWAMGAEGEHIKKMLPQFERLNPGIRVKVQAIPWGAAHEKLLTAFAGNSTPDVCQLGNTWIPEFQAIGALYPLDSLIEQSATIQKEAFFEGIWNTNIIGKMVYGIPWYVDTKVLFYRSDMLAKAGYPNPPQTWKEWLDASRKISRLHDAGAKKYAAYFSLIFNDGYVPVILIMENRGKFLKENDCYGAFDDPATMEALQFYLTFFREGLASRSQTEFTNIYQGFEDADFSMMIHGPWVASEIKKRSPDLAGKWNTAPMPLKKNRTSTPGGASLVIFKNARQPQAAWKLIEFLSRPETQVEFYRLTGDLPAAREAWQAAELQNDQEIQAFYQQLESVTPLPLIPEWEQIYVKIQEHLELVIFEKTTLEEAVKRLNREVDRILEKRRWLLERNLLSND